MLALKIIGFVLLGLAALLVLLLFVPVRLRVRYEDSLAVTLWVLFVPIRFSPKPKKTAEKQPADKPKQDTKSKPKKEKKKKSAQLDLASRARELKESGLPAAAAWLKETVSRLLKATDRLLKAITVTHLFAYADIAGEDAAQTAVTYGKLCGVIYPALGVVESKLKVKKQEVRIAPAFCLEATRFGFDVRLTVCVWRVVVAAVAFLISYSKMPSVGIIK